MKIIEIEGIGPVYAKKLNAIGILSVEAFLKQAATAKGRKELATKSDIDATLLLEWANRADLFRIKGIGAQYSDLLEKSGVDTVAELAKRVPANLLAKMIEINKAKNCVNQMPGIKQVEDWVDQAKKLGRVITY